VLQAGRAELAQVEAEQEPYAGLTVEKQRQDAALAQAEGRLAEERCQQVRGCPAPPRPAGCRLAALGRAQSGGIPAPPQAQRLAEDDQHACPNLQARSELGEVAAQCDQLAERLDGISDAHAATLEPIVAVLERELAALQEAVGQERQRAAAAQHEAGELRERLEQVGTRELRAAVHAWSRGGGGGATGLPWGRCEDEGAELGGAWGRCRRWGPAGAGSPGAQLPRLAQAKAEQGAAQQQRQEQRLALARVEAAPDKARRAADLAAADLRLAERQVEEVGRRVGGADAAVKAMEARLAALEVGAGHVAAGCRLLAAGCWLLAAG
jgi:hypothetical protein